MASTPLAARVNVQITDDMKARVVRLADKQGRKESEVVRAALLAYLNKEEKR
jgi:predicted transcriptional regulator